MTSRTPLKQSIHALLVCLSSALLTLHSAHAAKLYKWIDEEGNVRYSDRLTVEQSQQKHQTLTPDGRVIGTQDRALTQAERDEIKRKEEADKREAERQAQIKAEKDHHDRVLMMTFTSEAEILEAQSERLEVIDSVIKLLKKNIQKEKDKLTELEKRAQTQYIDKDKVVPGGLAQNIEYFSEKILNKQKQLELKIEEKARIKQQYADDMLRYRELSGNHETSAK